MLRNSKGMDPQGIILRKRVVKMKRHAISLMLVLAMAVTLAGCSDATTGNSSTTGTTAGKTTEAAGTTAATTVATTVAVSDSYGLDQLTGDLPSVSEPAEKDEERSKSEDGKWAIDNNCTIDGDKIIVNSTGGTAAFYGGQSLGTVWNASANFRPIKPIRATIHRCVHGCSSTTPREEKYCF